MVTLRRVALTSLTVMMVVGVTSYLMVCGFVESVE